MAPTGNDILLVAQSRNCVILDINCSKCSNVKNGILCDCCDKWWHFRSVNLIEECLTSENNEWKCPGRVREDAGSVRSSVGDVVSEEGRLCEGKSCLADIEL